MKTRCVRDSINLRVVRFELDFTPLPPQQPKPVKIPHKIIIPKEVRTLKKKQVPSPPTPASTVDKTQKRDVKKLVEELLNDIYADQRNWSSRSSLDYSRGSVSESISSSQSYHGELRDAYERSYLEDLDIQELRDHAQEWEERLRVSGERLARCVRTRDRLRRQQKRLCAAFTVLLRHITGEPGARFGVAPGEGPGEGGYSEWLHAMRLVARLPAGVPHHFRKKLWLTLAERHLTAKGIVWSAAERACFRGTALPDDEELGAQILKDLHRTGCSLFCGTEGRENQAMLRRVLLAYARWNKDVGYCQGFNMLAAIILEVMDKSESDSLKVMIYLVEAVLPEGYFADDLRGLSADMAAFRDLLRLRLPRLARHMDHLQRMSDGGGVEPPLPDVFTMQWFLTLYATWLPRDSLLRIWDLVLLDGNEVLLLTALAIWDMLQDRILSARSADEFYSCMGGGAGAVYEAGDALVARVVAFGSAPELPRLRNLHRYRVAPPAPPAPPTYHQPPLHSAVHSMTKRGLRLFYSEDEGDSSDDGNKMALATVIPRRDDRGAGDRLSLDIGALKRQYARLRERQRQAHVILAAACARHAAVGVPTSPTSLTVNNLLLGKSAIVSSRGRRLGPPPGAIPPSRTTSASNEKLETRSRDKKTETISWNEEKDRKSLSRRNSVKWKEIKKENDVQRGRKPSIDLDEAGDGIIVSEREANEMIASVRSRSSSETSSYSSRSDSSSDTSLCDENERGSDSEKELPEDEKIKKGKGNSIIDTKLMSTFKDEEIVSTLLPSDHATKYSSISTHSPVKLNLELKPTKDITDYLGSAAGEPLRTYIDGFESKSKGDEIVSYKIDDKYRAISPIEKISCYLPQETAESDKLQRLSQPIYEKNYKSNDLMRPKSFEAPARFTDLSPIDLSPCHYGLDSMSPCYGYDYSSSFVRPSPPKPDIISRPPDIIDNLTMYPNFVPDIDLSDKQISDIESPSRSPGAESIIVSEDEPPIPLKIDKYFEYSPEFFGARVTDPNNTDIPNRRSIRRYCRTPKKPDSLTLYSSHNEKMPREETERASSLPQSHSFSDKDAASLKIRDKSDKEYRISHHTEDGVKSETEIVISDSVETTSDKVNELEKISPKHYLLLSGRKNSERALQIIQENSKILSRILTKQNITDTSSINKCQDTKDITDSQCSSIYSSAIPEKIAKVQLIDSPLLKESTSDSVIGYSKSINNDTFEKNDFIKVRPISIDDPFSLEVHTSTPRNDEFMIECSKTLSNERLENKTDIYGWENKGFLAKCDYKSTLDDTRVIDCNIDFRRKPADFSKDADSANNEMRPGIMSDWSRHCYSGETKPKTSVTLPHAEARDTTYDGKITSDHYNYPLTSKYNDYILSKASDICSKTVDQGPKICDNISKSDTSQISDFAHVVTSSISFTYEPSVEDDSPIGAKSNSSDTLCQIASLDQVSTPISPKVFPYKETLTNPKEYSEKNDRPRLESDDTCSAITSLIDTDNTLSSLSYPRSPSTGSFQPFPTRPVMRMPKELGVRLGMYPKDAISSPQK